MTTSRQRFFLSEHAERASGRDLIFALAAGGPGPALVAGGLKVRIDASSPDPMGEIGQELGVA